jgi:hypothetical protein
VNAVDVGFIRALTATSARRSSFTGSIDTEMLRSWTVMVMGLQVDGRQDAVKPDARN